MSPKQITFEFLVLVVFGVAADVIGYRLTDNVLNVWSFYLFLLLSCIYLSRTKNGWRFGRPTNLRSILREIGILIVSLIVAVVGLRHLKLPAIFDPRSAVDWAVLLGFAPLSEEIVYRQALFLRWAGGSRAPRAPTIAASILFMFRHLGFVLPLLPIYYAGIGGLASDGTIQFIALQSFLSIFIGGVLFQIRTKAKSLLPSLVAHSLFNAGFLFGELLRS